MFHDFSRILREMKMVIATMKNMRHDSGIFDTVHRALLSILSFAPIINNPVRGHPENTASSFSKRFRIVSHNLV